MVTTPILNGWRCCTGNDNDDVDVDVDDNDDDDANDNETEEARVSASMSNESLHSFFKSSSILFR